MIKIMDIKEKLKSHADLLDEMADTCTGGFVHIVPDTAKEIADDIKEHLDAEEEGENKVTGKS